MPNYAYRYIIMVAYLCHEIYVLLSNSPKHFLFSAKIFLLIYVVIIESHNYNYWTLTFVVGVASWGFPWKCIEKGGVCAERKGGVMRCFKDWSRIIVARLCLDSLAPAQQFKLLIWEDGGLCSSFRLREGAGGHTELQERRQVSDRFQSGQEVVGCVRDWEQRVWLHPQQVSWGEVLLLKLIIEA